MLKGPILVATASWHDQGRLSWCDWQRNSKRQQRAHRRAQHLVTQCSHRPGVACLEGMPTASEAAFASRLRNMLARARQVDCYTCLEDDVDSEEVPGYRDVIKSPMSFSAIDRVSLGVPNSWLCCRR